MHVGDGVFSNLITNGRFSKSKHFHPKNSTHSFDDDDTENKNFKTFEDY